jgi:chromosome segregation ATPase
MEQSLTKKLESIYYELSKIEDTIIDIKAPIDKKVETLQKQVNNLSLKLNLTEMQEDKLVQLEDEINEMEELRDKLETILDNMQNTIIEFDFSMEILNHNLEKLKKRIATQ